LTAPGTLDVMGGFIEAIGNGITGLVAGAFDVIGDTVRGIVAFGNQLLPGGLFWVFIFFLLLAGAWTFAKR